MFVGECDGKREGAWVLWRCSQEDSAKVGLLVLCTRFVVRSLCHRWSNRIGDILENLNLFEDLLLAPNETGSTISFNRYVVFSCGTHDYIKRFSVMIKVHPLARSIAHFRHSQP